MNASIIEIMNAVATAKTQIKTAVAAAKSEAPKGQKMPYGQHANFVASSAMAKATTAAVEASGYVQASCRFTKAGDYVVTYRQPVTLADRLTKHAASVAKRAEQIAERKAKRDAAKAEKVTPIAAGRVDLSAIAGAVRKAA